MDVADFRDPNLASQRPIGLAASTDFADTPSPLADDC